MWIYGRNPVLEALQQGQAERLVIAAGVKKGAVAELHKAARAAGVPVETVPRIELDRALGTTSHQGVAAELPELEHAPLEDALARATERDERLLLVLLDQVQDPRNYGAIIRSAEVFGAHGVVTETRRSAPLSAVVAKTAAGAASHLPLVQVANLPTLIRDLKRRNVWIYGADEGGETTPDRVDWDRDVALVIGSEGSGLRRLVGELCDERVAIPTKGRIGSLNASVAAGVMLYAVQSGRDRTQRGG
ncbi:MAG: 23S rRNA (guanosine(2251)-2'-O)-methyltransferase RlmB [Trueperaceae bacterium]|nr:23S rRNA (guanosine(2251)-2'-O)-methyltransferase RlmB [Trueperaceae bacterium]